ncbi:unnamed protein product [Eruca vesicaria subsp. sativa]|uniref:Uncharacterized protein n=1 Tax=Eruca vesicaria subsp. sativa TaxID=29727 RepID=A0ABC8L2U7_ERUVS|nr:unnamed protein product [Eruca vesicaria subsp. sativa]
MGSLVGHVLPGFAFLILGLWHLFNNIKLFCLRPNTFMSSSWFPTSKVRYLELYLIMFSTSASISMELFIGPRRHHPFDSDGTIPSNHLHNFEHSSISMSFFVYAFCALVLDRERPRAAAAEGLTILAATAAFTQQLLLFHFHSADHMGVEGQYHLILQLIIFVSLLTTLMGIALPRSFLVSLVRSSSIAFQGMWLIMIGYMLYTPSLIPKGCFIHDEERHKGVKCSTEEALHRAKSLVNIAFSWLFVINTIFVVTLYLILDRNYGRNVEYSSLTTNYQSEQYDEEQQHSEPQSTQKMRFVEMGKVVDHGDKL